MGTVVNVILSGIVSLVPESEGSGYQVLLPRDTRKVSTSELHYPSILAEARHTSTSLRVAKAKPDHDPIYKAWKIENGTIEIENAIESGPLVHAALLDVLEIAGACPEDNARKCAISKHDVNGVRLEVKRGELKTIGREPFSWYFKGKTACRPAEEVLWTFKILDPPLRLSIPNGQKDRVQFTVYAPPGKDIEIRLQNVPDQDLIPTPEDPPPHEDEHVDLYFEHSSNPPKNRPVKLLRTQDSPVREKPPNYRLAGRKIVKVLYGGTTGSLAKRRKFDPRVVRVNCPPALWDGFQP